MNFYSEGGKSRAEFAYALDEKYCGQDICNAECSIGRESKTELGKVQGNYNRAGGGSSTPARTRQPRVAKPLISLRGCAHQQAAVRAQMWTKTVMVTFLVIMAALSGWLFTPVTVQCEAAREEETEESSALLMDEIEGYLDIAELEESVSELLQTDDFSFWDTVKKLIAGEIPFSMDLIVDTISAVFLDELLQQKKLIWQILLIAIASAVFSNFVRVFDSHQISDVSFYMAYLMLSTLLMRAFLSLENLVSETCGTMFTFMEILLPSYLITVVISAGTVTAIGFYQVSLLAIGLLETVIGRLILPAIRAYILLLILNQLSREDYFSGIAALLETVITWSVKTVLGIAVGLGAVQCLVTPAIDSLKSTALGRAISVIPGVGTILGAAAQTVAGSAVVIKNAVGVAGILALALICLTPLAKLSACVLLFRALRAVIWPVCEKRLTDGIESVCRGSVLLLRVLSSSLAVFVILLAMITASVRNG
ncbi:MAG: stage III sporulation protein AE [Lachnospiraceae bacterium]|nr:stage III sporulation protein AE [Lachnospiraceae bacterium]